LIWENNNTTEIKLTDALLRLSNWDKKHQCEVSLSHGYWFHTKRKFIYMECQR
jgi:hypothetical protein